MNCPLCNRPTRRLVYDKRGKRCLDCQNPNFIRDIVTQIPEPSPEIHRLDEMLRTLWARPGEKLYKCVITPNTKTLQ